MQKSPVVRSAISDQQKWIYTPTQTTLSTLYSNNTAGKKVMNPLPSAQCTHAQLSAWLAHCIPCDEVRIMQRAQRTSQSLANKPKPSQPR